MVETKCMSRKIFGLGRLELIWQNQDVLQRVQSQVTRKTRPSIYDPGSNWYEAWYFALRLDEEIVRSRRYSHVMALVSLAFSDLGAKISPQRVEFKNTLSKVAETRLRQTDIPGVLEQDEIAVCLPQTDREGARIVAGRLAEALAFYRPRFGLAVYPADGVDAGDLLRAAFTNTVSELALPEGEDVELPDQVSLLER